jgi:SHAQKYF class myb-like DNA-binding protein
MPNNNEDSDHNDDQSYMYPSQHAGKEPPPRPPDHEEFFAYPEPARFSPLTSSTGQQQELGNRSSSPDANNPSSHSHLSTTQATKGSALATAAAAAAAASGGIPQQQQQPSQGSVVPDLMRVYESMVQSKTPHSNITYPNQQLQRDYGHHQHQAPALGSSYSQQRAQLALSQHHNGEYYRQDHQDQAAPQQPWNCQVSAPENTSSVTIPPPYQLPSAIQAPIPEPLSRRTSNASAAAEEATSMGGRPQRKRNAPIKQEPSGYASSTSSSRGGNKRRKSSKDGKKKGKDVDGRWSKRFTWPEELHRDFVSAVFDVGLKHASPSIVLEQMPSHEHVTTERIKSHLQKYRLHRQKSKKDFMSSYSSALTKVNAEGLDGVTSLAGGQVAAHLTYSALTQPDPDPSDSSTENTASATASSLGGHPSALASPALPPITVSNAEKEEVFVLPRLTEEERKSHIGMSLGYLMGLFFSLKEQLDLHRQETEHKKQQEQQAAASVYDAFVREQEAAAAAAAADKNSAGIDDSRADIGPAIPATARSNLEESSMMKREMQNQRAFQNKMRALKQQELNKYNLSSTGPPPAASHHHHYPQEQHRPEDDGGLSSTDSSPIDQHQRAIGQPQQHKHPHLPPPSTTAHQQHLHHHHQQQQQQHQFHAAAHEQQVNHQGAGETAGTDETNASGRERLQSMSIQDEEFWNNSVVDDELFNFLMND